MQPVSALHSGQSLQNGGGGILHLLAALNGHQDALSAVVVLEGLGLCVEGVQSLADRSLCVVVADIELSAASVAVDVCIVAVVVLYAGYLGAASVTVDVATRLPPILFSTTVTLYSLLS